MPHGIGARTQVERVGKNVTYQAASALRRVVAAGTALIVIYFVVRSFAGVSEALLLAFFGVLLAILLDVPTTIE